ncbi:hypothetical protein I6E81_07195 [Salinibacterium sp. NG22]|uniref:hypothetical protein n=1 Tax=Salinibacterium sp. NG22 TaxID=2792040 RepID=UPI0018CEDAFE|nr:hypothetical protein [Salinibacterium sp. NG22]MBH0109948.1 hypothetical protein [Salinibacterium sp. NG22]
MPDFVVLIWFSFRSTIIGLALAVVWRLARGRKGRLPAGLTAVATVAATSLALACLIYLNAAIGFPLLRPPLSEHLPLWVFEMRVLWALGIGILAVALLAIPIGAHTPRGHASLTRRTPFSFGHRWWFAGITTIVGTIVTVSILAGLASEPDEDGLWRNYTVDAGSSISFGTRIYGWYYSVPALILLAALIAVTIIVLWLIARPSLSTDHDDDVRMRHLRTWNILAIASGTLLIHLGSIFTSLSNTAMLRGGAAIGESGWGSWTTPFAAMQPALLYVGLGIAALGYALWFGVLLSAVFMRRTSTGTGTGTGTGTVRS